MVGGVAAPAARTEPTAFVCGTVTVRKRTGSKPSLAESACSVDYRHVTKEQGPGLRAEVQIAAFGAARAPKTNRRGRSAKLSLQLLLLPLQLLPLSCEFLQTAAGLLLRSRNNLADGV